MNESPDRVLSQNKETGVSEEQEVRTTEQSARDSNQRKTSSRINDRTSFGLLTRRSGIAALILACVVLFSLYVRVADYGFYEDDYWGIVPWFKTSAAELWKTTI